MNRTSVVALPGMDGGADLFEPFVATAPKAFDLRPVTLPSNGPQSYRRLTEHVLDALPPDSVILIGASFSGPLAVLVANRCRRVVGLVLCTTFIRSPIPAWLTHLPDWMWRATPRAAVLRALLTGGDAPLADAVRRAISRTGGAVIAERFAALSRVDVRAEFARLSMPVLYVRATRDRLIAPRTADEMLGVRPSTQIADVDGPHLVLQTNPGDAWHHITPFIERAGVAGPSDLSGSL